MLFHDATGTAQWACMIVGAIAAAAVMMTDNSRSVTQIPQCTSLISHNAPFCNRNVHVCTLLLQNGVLCDICVMHRRIFEMGLLVVTPFICCIMTYGDISSLHCCWDMQACYMLQTCWITVTLLKYHGVSNHWQINCLFNSLFMLQQTRFKMIHITGPLGRESTNTQQIPPTKGQ